MREFLSINIDSKNMHHAYLFAGAHTVADEISEFLKSLYEGQKENIDISIEKHHSFTVDESRLLKAMHTEKGNDGKRFFVISAEFFTREAENALLKAVEEPPLGVHFFFVTPRPWLLVPTLRSRMQFIKSEDDVTISKEDLKKAESFLKALKGERIKIIGEIIKNHEDDENSAPLRNEAMYLLSALEFVLYKKNKDTNAKDNKTPFSKEEQLAFDSIYKSRDL